MQIVVATGEHLASSTNHETAHCAIFAASFCFLRIRPKYLTQHPKWWLILLKTDSCLQCVNMNTNEKCQMARNVWDMCTRRSNILVHWHWFYVSFYQYVLLEPIPVATMSKAWVYGRSVTGVSGSNPVRSMDAWFLWVCCVVRWSSLLRADHLSRGVIRLAYACVSQCDCETLIMRSPWPCRGFSAVGEKGCYFSDTCFKTALSSLYIMLYTFCFLNLSRN